MNRFKRYRDKHKHEHSYKEANKKRVKLWRGKYPERCAESNRKQYQKGKLENPEKLRKQRSDWKKKNRAYCSAGWQMYQAKKIKAMPGWANTFFIREIYDLAKLRQNYLGRKYHVDHIVPLRHKRVCGLHCEANLQILDSSINMSKANRFWPGMPN